MQKLTLHSKTGFTTPQRGVEIYDTKGRPFYVRENVRGVFNLPKGEYLTNDILSKCKPRKYRVKPLPIRERNFPKKPFKYVIQPYNSAKCQIDKETGTVYISNEFWKDLNLPEKIFILKHEEGHYRYGTETFCDLYAATEMLKLGFNPSQIKLAIHNTLSPKNWNRKKRLIFSYFNK